MDFMSKILVTYLAFVFGFGLERWR